MSEVIRMIHENASCHDIIKKLQENYDHEDFKHNFKKAQIEFSQNVAKYILRQITIQMGTKHNDVTPHRFSNT